MWDIIQKDTWAKMQTMFPKEAWPDGNKAPANFRRVTEEEFCRAHYYIGYSEAATGYFQLRTANDGTPLEEHAYGKIFINSFGKGWFLDYYGKVPRYYLFELCQHEYETTEKRMCYWAGTCKKCGHKHAVDSSD